MLSRKLSLVFFAKYYEQSGNMTTADLYRQKVQSVFSISVK